VRRLAIFSMAAGMLLAGDTAGIRPRGNITDYPAHQAGKTATIAAAVIPPEQVAKLFATDLNRAGYIVMEVAVYPQDGNEVEVMSRDFLLRIGADPTTFRAASAQAISAGLQRKNAPKPHGPGDVTVYPSTTIGYESGPTYNGQRRGGVYTSSGVGVGIGDPGPSAPRPASTNQDRSVMQQELEDKGLPQGRTTQPVAGYLFFPKPSSNRKADATYDLTYYSAMGQVSLVVPPAKKK